jgi:hypothetical protein
MAPLRCGTTQFTQLIETKGNLPLGSLRMDRPLLQRQEAFVQMQTNKHFWHAKVGMNRLTSGWCDGT